MDSTVKRRSVLGGLGAAATASVLQTDVVQGLGGQTRIVAGRAGTNHEAVATKKVPKEWLRHQQELRRVTDRLREAYENRPYVGSVSYVATDRMKDGVYFAQPEIAVRPGTTAAKRDRLPESVEQAGVESSGDLRISDIAIREMNGEFTPQNTDCYRGVTENTFPGGLEIQDGDSSGIGTAGFKVWKDGTGHLYTANHVLQSGSCSIAGGSADDADGNKLGTTVDGHKTHDWVTVSNGNASYDNTIQYDEGSSDIDGYATQNGMESIQGQKGTLSFQGVISGKQDAYVKGGGATATAGCIQMYGSATKIGMPDYARSGDSGGPYWWEKSSTEDLVVGAHSMSEDAGSYSACNISGSKGRPCYVYPFWRVSNNTNYTVKDV